MPDGTADGTPIQLRSCFVKPLNARGFGDIDAARFQIQHGFAFGAHLHFEPGTGGEAHFQAARGVGRGQEALRPWGIVTVGEDRLGAVNGWFRVAGGFSMPSFSSVASSSEHRVSTPGRPT